MKLVWNMPTLKILIITIYIYIYIYMYVYVYINRQNLKKIQLEFEIRI